MVQGYAGVGSDHWGGYGWIAADLRLAGYPLGASHLIREFAAVPERGGASGALGAACLDEADRTSVRWHRVRGGTTDRAAFTLLMVPLQAELRALLTTGLAIAQPQTRYLRRSLLEFEPATPRWYRPSSPRAGSSRPTTPPRGAFLWHRHSFGTAYPRGVSRRQPLRGARAHRGSHPAPAGPRRARLFGRCHPDLDWRDAHPRAPRSRRSHSPRSPAYPR